jgi:multidrug efflux pump subunit AcrA (membrane-fusion protein)
MNTRSTATHRSYRSHRSFRSHITLSIAVCSLICCTAFGSDSTPLTIESALLTVAEQAEVPARDAGVIVKITAFEGQRVEAGEVLASLDDAEVKLARMKATIDLQRAQKLAVNDIKLRSAKVELAYAEAELTRANDAGKKLANSVSEAEFDRLRSNVRRATLEIEQAQFELDAAKSAVSLFENELQMAEEKLRRRCVSSPISGVIVSLPKRVGEWVEPGQSLARVLSIKTLRVEFFVNAPRATPDLVGKTVRFTLPGSLEPESFTGRVAFVSPEVDSLSNQVRVRAEIDNRTGRLRPGLTGSLTFVP